MRSVSWVACRLVMCRCGRPWVVTRVPAYAWPSSSAASFSSSAAPAARFRSAIAGLDPAEQHEHLVRIAGDDRVRAGAAQPLRDQRRVADAAVLPRELVTREGLADRSRLSVRVPLPTGPPRRLQPP